MGIRTGSFLVIAALTGTFVGGAPDTRAESPTEGERSTGEPAQLEFRVLANENDEAAIEAAQAYFAEASRDPKRKDELRRAAEEGKPPPAPRGEGAKGFGTRLGTFTYSWVELGKPQLRAFRLEGDTADHPDLAAQRKAIAEAREQGSAISFGWNRGLLYSRARRSSKRSEGDRNKKAVEYFMLVRDPPQGKAITGRHLISVRSGVDSKSQPAVLFRLDKGGGELMHELTSRNGPTGPREEPRYAQLAILLDSQIISASTIRSPFSTDAHITGLTQQDVEFLVKRLRQGMSPEK
jgi:hypothetical protein